jgi:hypothetical protein
MAGFGIPHDEIAKILSVDPKTLRKHFEQELELADARSVTEEESDWGDLLKVEPWSLRSGLRD